MVICPSDSESEEEVSTSEGGSRRGGSDAAAALAAAAAADGAEASGPVIPAAFDGTAHEDGCAPPTPAQLLYTQP